jgi:RND family efflux transporter MFP subunit
MTARPPATAAQAPDGDAGEPRRRAMRRIKIAALVVLALLAVGAARTVVSRISNARDLEATASQSAKLYVRTTQPQRGGDGNRLSLPGTLQGNVQAPIAARASGYLKRWYKDIGSRVEKGELLAEIESPEIDQQLSQAVAARAEAAATLALARSTVARFEELRKSGMVPMQQLEERRSADVQAQASLAAADANIARLRDLQGFKRVVAPFSGVITKRSVEVGDLIDAGAARTLFTLTQTDPLRVYVDVPQAYAHLVKVGQKVTVTQNEMRGRAFEGQVARTAASIDPTSRTMQIEVALPNRDGALLPGAYVQVALPLQAGKETVIPTAALMFRSEGLRVAAVDAAGKVKLLNVKVGRNFGQTVEVLEGLQGNERLVLNPSDALASGDTVSIAH